MNECLQVFIMVVNNHILFYIVSFHPKHLLSAIIDGEAHYLSTVLTVEEGRRKQISLRISCKPDSVLDVLHSLLSKTHLK